MTATGKCAWSLTWVLTDPITSRANPPAPRDPHDDHVSVPGRAQEFARRGAADDLNCHRLGPGLAQLVQYPGAAASSAARMPPASALAKTAATYPGVLMP
jgi:hypothetical protein